MSRRSSTCRASTVEPVQPFTLDEARTFFEYVHGTRLEAVYLTAMLTGMRRGEVLALRWSDVDLAADSISVTGSLQGTGPEPRRDQPKTRQSRRTIAIPGVLSDTLRMHRVQQLVERLHAREWHGRDYVFTTTLGTPIEPRNLTRWFQGAVEKAGLRKQRFHDLRHCYATLQLASNTPAWVVMEQLGIPIFRPPWTSTAT